MTNKADQIIDDLIEWHKRVIAKYNDKTKLELTRSRDKFIAQNRKRIIRIWG